MKCAAFASWLLLLASTEGQESRSLLRTGRPDQIRSLQAVWDSAVSKDTRYDNNNVVLAGIIHHGAEISTNSLNFVLDVACVYKVRTHILGADDMQTLAAMYGRLKEQKFPGHDCAPFKVSTQPDYVSAEKNRINRIQAARDYQRFAVAEQFDFDDREKATIILADLDVSELPPIDQVIGNADKMNHRNGVDVDILCSNGKMLNPYGYYDTFATVLLPDTFVYPVNGRSIMEARPQEDVNLIIGENFTAYQLMEWFKTKGGADANPVPVKSCFGGLAIYRASKWLDQRCSYMDLDPQLNAKYANRYDDAPCEHVVLHNCLQAVDPTVVVAVQPDMHTIWHTSAGPQYALSSFPDIAAEFFFDHLGAVRNSRHLQALNSTGSNSTGFNSTGFNSTGLNATLFRSEPLNWTESNSTYTVIYHFLNSTSNYTEYPNATTRTEIPQWIIDLIFDSPIFDINCSVTNATNSSMDTNFTASNCTEVAPERRMEKINDLIRFLVDDCHSNCTNATANCTNSTPVFDDFIRMVYDGLDYDGNFTNATANATRDLELDSDKILDTQYGPVDEHDEFVKPKLDFFIAGFPKCGTTSLRYAFEDHTETSISKVEHCSIADPELSDHDALAQLDIELAMLSQDPSVKRGLKCPIGITNAHAIDRIDEHSPYAKLLIGIRHPVKYFQSYYNYRVTELHDNNVPLDDIPAIETLIGMNEWEGISTDTARFELYLMQLGKTEMTVSDFEDMAGRPHLAVKPNKFKIFLYALSQMEDEIEDRTLSFRQQLRTFLGLDKPMQALEQMNKNNFLGDNAHDETVDICNSQYDSVRALLVNQGTKTAAWIRDEFMKSPDVVVANKEHFLAMLDTWSSDPCQEGAQPSSEGGFWYYITSFMAPFFDLIYSIFG